MRLKITRASGEESIHSITPSIEFAFEVYAKKGFYRAFSEDQKQSDVYWLAWECLRKDGITVPTFGAAFIDTLAKVEVLGDEDSPNS
jgi:hypothetical protein